MFQNPRTGRQAKNFTTNASKILDLKSSSEQIFSENLRWVPLGTPTSQDRFGLRQLLWPDYSTYKSFDSSTKVRKFARAWRA